MNQACELVTNHDTKKKLIISSIPSSSLLNKPNESCNHQLTKKRDSVEVILQTYKVHQTNIVMPKLIKSQSIYDFFLNKCFRFILSSNQIMCIY